MQSTRSSLSTATRRSFASSTTRNSPSAAVVRYSAIRTFFRQQHDDQCPSLRNRFSLIAHSTHRNPIGPSQRTFHMSGLNLQTKNPSSPSSEPTNSSKHTTPSTPDQQNAPKQPPTPHSSPHNFENYSRFYQRLAMSLPHLHRPTRDDFLNVTSGFWQRLRIRFKWFTIKSFRKFNADDISAFVTLVVMSQTVWILVGTTTFFSVVFATANSLRLQEYIARAISDYLTSETGVTIIFESAIVPKWKDSRISFKNVYISRRPSTSPSDSPRKPPSHLAVSYDVSGHPAYHLVGEDEEELDVNSENPEDVNYSMFDLNVDSIDVTLSLWRWLDGKGLIEDAVIKGVRGILDRRSVEWDPSLLPALFRHPFTPGSFELDSLQLEDVLITVYQPGDFRPYTASIFRADLRQFRKQWLFYDLLSAENIVGQFDGCLFSLHKPQSIGRTTEKDLKDGGFERMSRIRIDGVSIDHLQGNTSDNGPISWITSGKVDVVFDIKFPSDPNSADNASLPEILGEIAESISTNLSGETHDPKLARIPGQRELARPALSAPEDEDGNRQRETDPEEEEIPKVVLDIDVRFRDVKAAVPMFTNDLSYVNNALVRPIVAFMNANRTLVPIRCRVVKELNDFDGSWTMWETGLTDEISLKIYEALAYHVTQSNINKRIKTVSIWSLQMTARAVLSALRTVIDPMTAHVREAYDVGYGAAPEWTAFTGARMVD